MEENKWYQINPEVSSLVGLRVFPVMAAVGDTLIIAGGAYEDGY